MAKSDPTISARVGRQVRSGGNTIASVIGIPMVMDQICHLEQAQEEKKAQKLLLKTRREIFQRCGKFVEKSEDWKGHNPAVLSEEWKTGAKLIAGV